jgi:predicted RNA methylase
MFLRTRVAKAGVDRCDLVISELLDHTFVGEGMVPALRDAYTRLLVPDAPSVPSSGTVRVALISAPTLGRFRHNPDDCGDTGDVEETCHERYVHPERC